MLKQLSLVVALLAVVVLIHAEDAPPAEGSGGNGLLTAITAPFVGIANTLVASVTTGINGFIAVLTQIGGALYTAMMAVIMAIPNLIMLIVHSISGGGAAPAAPTA